MLYPDKREISVDLNQFLLWFGFLSSTLQLFQGIRFSQRLITWKAFAIVLLMSVLCFVLPEQAGVIGFCAWGVLLGVPVVLMRIVSLLLAGERYRPARALGRVLGLLHPGDGFREMPALIAQLADAVEGKPLPPLSLALAHGVSQSRLQRQAYVLMLRKGLQWETLVRWIEEQIPVGMFRLDPALILAYLRGLGELGRLDRLVEALHAHRAFLFAPALAPIRHQGYLLAFSFCGQTQPLGALLAGPLRRLSPAARDFHLAIAQQATGCLTEPSRALLEELASDLEQELRFGPVGLAGTGQSRATLGLAGFISLVFLVQVFMGGANDPEILYRMGALWSPGVLQGEWWRVLTSVFLHYGFLHVFLNLFALVVLTPFLERSIGPLVTTVVFLLSGVGSMLLIVLSCALDWISPRFVLGASGAIFGIVGATSAVLLRGWLTHKSLLARRQLLRIASIVLLQVVFDLCTPQSSLACHLGGCLLDFLLALPLLPSSTPGRPPVTPCQRVEAER